MLCGRLTSSFALSKYDEDKVISLCKYYRLYSRFFHKCKILGRSLSPVLVIKRFWPPEALNVNNTNMAAELDTD